MRNRLTQLAALWAVVGVLAGCGGGGSEQAADAAPPTIGIDGGSVSAQGVKLVIPPGAMAAETTLRIAKDSTGAPPLPKWAQAAGDMVAITPHGSEFSEPVTVRVPVPNVTLQANQKLFIAKAQPGGEWEVLGDTVHKDGLLEVQVRSFSFFSAVVVTFLPPTGPVARFEPFDLGRPGLECDGVPCADPELVRPMTITATITNNGGQLPADCVNPQIALSRNGGDRLTPSVDAVPGAVIRQDFPMPRVFDRMVREGALSVRAALRCTDTATNTTSSLLSTTANLQVSVGSTSRTTPLVVQFPAQLTQAVGDAPTIRAVMVGGAANISANSTSVTVAVPSESDEAVVFLERLAPTDNVWRTLATSRQSAANPSPFPFGTAPAWLYWSFDYALEPLTAADNGAVYRMRACYALPPATQLSCTVGPTARMTVVQHILIPTFSLQPQSMLVTPGQTASFSAVAGGAPAPTLQWQTRPANSTGDWANVSPSSSSTTANYTTPAIGLADNGVQYRVLATNAAGSTASQAVIVSVTLAAEGPTIVSEPVGLSVVAGSEAVLAVGAKGTGALSYQWRKRPANATVAEPIVGANGAQLKLSNTTASDAGVYEVIVSNAVGSITSASVEIRVVSGSVSPPVAPSIVTQPAAVAVTEGNVATFAVGVSGSGPLSFQWRKNGVDIAGATAAAHTLPAVAAADAGNYSVLVTNSAGSVASQAATLAVSGAQVAPPSPPTIVTQPGTLVVAPGMSAMFGVAAQGSGTLSYQWLRDGAVVAGQTSAIYSIASASALDAGTYQVRVSNSAGSVTSASSQLILLGAPVITAQPVAVAATEGATATFGITATGDALRYQWVRNGVAIAGANTASHTTPATTLGDSGAVYAVIVYNGAGLVFSQSAVLTITPAAPVAKAWGSAALIETDDAGNAESVRIAVNASGQAVAAWQQSDGASINIYANRYTPAEGWGTRQRISPVVLETAQQPQVAIDGEGNAIVVWVQSNFTQNSSSNNIWARRYTPQGGWGNPTLIEDGIGDAGSPQIAIDGAGNAIVVFWQHQGASIDIVANRYVNGAGWGTAAAIESDSTGGGSAPQIAIDAAGNATVVWAWGRATSDSSFEFSIWANRYTAGSGWGTAGPIDSTNGTGAQAPQVALDGAGNALAVWHRPDGTWDSIWASLYVPGIGWGDRVLVETDNTNAARNAQVAFDANGNAMAVWTQSDGLRDNVLANRYTPGQGWGSAVLIETDNAGSAMEPRIVLDGNGNATAVWSQRNVAAFSSAIWANRWSPATGWGTAATIGNAATGARAPQIGVDGLGNVIAAWAQSNGARTDIWANALR